MSAVINFLNNKWLLRFIIVFSLSLLFKQSDQYYHWTNSKKVKEGQTTTINTDGAGYYAYLPQFFIYQEKPHFQFIKEISEKYKHTQFISGIYYNEHKHYGIDKYYVGTGILMSPVFIITHSINSLFEYETDGYSRAYQLCVAFSAILYWLIGVIGLIYLMNYFNVSNGLKIVMIITLTFATNLNFYTVYFPSFSHVYSFATITWLFYFLLKLKDHFILKFIIPVAILLGFVFLIRPTNLMIGIVIPFLVFNKSNIKLRLLEYKLLIIPTILFFSLVFVQLYINYLQIGEWTFNTYKAEGFDYLSNPKWKEVLWSYRKGLFVYGPVLLWLVPGVIFSIKKNAKLTIIGIVLFLVWLYLTSSWWCWWYGGGLGMRPFVDLMGFFVIYIALLLKDYKKVMIMYLLTLIPAVYLYQTNQIQYYKNILHYDNMSKVDYWRTFMKTDNRFSWMLHLKNDTIEDHQIVNKKSYFLDQQTTTWGLTQKVYKHFLNLKYEVVDPELTIPLKKIVQYGFRFNGELEIGNQDSNPAFSLLFYKEGNEIGWKHNYAGMLIDKRDSPQKFIMDYIVEPNYRNADSVRIVFSKGVPYTAVRNLQFDLLELN
ncbi:MAG: hypothetical protein ACON4M_01755 [Crocinitomicaceae bacterium]